MPRSPRFISAVGALAAGLSSVVASPVHGLQSSSPPDTSSCSCAAQLDAFVSAVESNYVGFALAWRGARRGEYERRLAGLRDEARRARDEDCLALLRRYVHGFRDGHLFVSDVPGANVDTTVRRPLRLAPLALTDDSVRARLAAAGAGRDAIEGIWRTAEGIRIGVVRWPAGARDRFAGVVLDDGVAGWERGAIRATFVARGDGNYDATVLSDARVPFHPAVFRPEGTGARIHRGVLLHMPPVTWGRVEPAAAHEAERLAPSHPRAPLVFPYAGAAGVWVVSMPSFDFAHRRVLDSLLAVHGDSLARARLLIVDVRGNEGGSSAMPRGVERFFGAMDASRSSRAWEAAAVVLSSPGNVRYYEQMMAQGWIPKGLPERMRARPGEVVPFADSAAVPGPTPAATPARGKEPRVAVLIDRGVVSAGTAFAMRARQFDRVQLVGEPTGGMIDYQNVRMMRVGCGRAGLLLGLPTLAASARLPEGALNESGVKPDATVRMGGDVYAAVVQAMR